MKIKTNIKMIPKSNKTINNYLIDNHIIYRCSNNKFKTAIEKEFQETRPITNC